MTIQMIDAVNIDTQELLTESDSFCIMPWIHVHQSPDQTVSGCCICVPSNSTDDELSYRVNTGNIDDMVNSEFMKTLRTGMLTGVKNSACDNCYKMEGKTSQSPRQQNNKKYAHHVDVVNETKPNGALFNFKMRYYDIRYTNLCNFKCRSCTAGFSSAWQAENKQFSSPDIIPLIAHTPANRLISSATGPLLKQLMAQISNLEHAYFAGGEPLMMEDHYVLLREMIAMDRTDITLSYNTNVSKLSLENEKILDLWAKFDNEVHVGASIDAVGTRAEYIRHGTHWPTIHDNLIMLRKHPKVVLSLSVVVSVYNYLYLDELLEYVTEYKLIDAESGFQNLIRCTLPNWLDPRTLPADIKQQAERKLNSTINNLEMHGYNIQPIRELIQWVNSEDLSSDERSQEFLEHTAYLDYIRQEDFVDTFPELQGLVLPSDIIKEITA
jgi:hypothetical protein